MCKKRPHATVEKKLECPLNGECKTSALVYRADVITDENNNEVKMTYFGQTLRPFKDRFYEHTQALKTETSQHATALSRYAWKLKKAKKNFTIKWSIKSKAPTYQSGSRKCQLCWKEKCAIALFKPQKLLNKRTEILTKCIHLINFELRKFKKCPPKGGGP